MSPNQIHACIIASTMYVCHIVTKPRTACPATHKVCRSLITTTLALYAIYASLITASALSLYQFYLSLVLSVIVRSSLPFAFVRRAVKAIEGDRKAKLQAARLEEEIAWRELIEFQKDYETKKLGI